ncbi:MAG: hypothetical protein IJ772_01860 [Bacilli bacterium]|nr:hypothetical protein [Bacilli bacterium]
MKKYIALIAMVFLAIVIILITDTYALFETNATGEKGIEIGAWNIKINDTDISLAKTLNITDFKYSDTPHTEDNYFAPGRDLSFPIHIDASNTEVSIEYAIDIDDSVLEEHPNIQFKFSDEDENREITSNHIEGVLLLNEQREKNLKIILDWNDITQYDEEDTSLIGHEFDFTIHANFKQYIGE